WRNGGLSDPMVRAVYVCICNGITDHDIRRAAEAGCGTLSELTMRTGVGACCGSCVEPATALLEEARPAAPGLLASPRLAARAAAEARRGLRAAMGARGPTPHRLQRPAIACTSPR